MDDNLGTRTRPDGKVPMKRSMLVNCENGNTDPDGSEVPALKEIFRFATRNIRAVLQTLGACQGNVRWCQLALPKRSRRLRADIARMACTADCCN